jgi:eukaryotic translation initiation factor 2C
VLYFTITPSIVPLGVRNAYSWKISSANADSSRPNAEVTMVENEYMKSSSAALGLKSLKISPPSPYAGDFPERPGHGTRGNQIAVYANYFELNVSPEPLVVWRYSVEVKPVKSPKPNEKQTVSKVKTKQLITLLLQLPGFEGVASDSRSNLISFHELVQPEVFEIAYRAPGEDEPPANPDTYRIRVKHTASYNVSDLLGYLRSAQANVPPYNVRQEIIQALNIVIGHYAQSSNNASTIGQGKHYSLNRDLANRRSFGGGIEALRGFFRSVRPATSRLLLNVNVSHAVCYESMRLDELMKAFGLGDKVILARHLKYLRVQKRHLPSRKNKAGEVVSNLASIYDLATINDGGTGNNAPQVMTYGAGPKNVKFYLEPSTHDSSAQPLAKGSSKKSGVGGYISVWDYFRRSKYPWQQSLNGP